MKHHERQVDPGLGRQDLSTSDSQCNGLADWMREAMSTVCQLSISPGDRLALIAAIQFIDPDTGEMDPGLEAWAQKVVCTTRGLEISVERLKSKGMLEVVKQSRGGRGVRTRYRVPALAPKANSPHVPALRLVTTTSFGQPPPSSHDEELVDSVTSVEIRQTPNAVPQTPNAVHQTPNAKKKSSGGVRGGLRAQPNSVVPEKKRQQQQQHPELSPDAVVVANYLGNTDLLTHDNATSERLQYLARVAGTMRNPGGYCADFIRKGWKVPVTPECEKKKAKRQRDALLEKYDSMPDGERTNVMARVRREFPNLVGYGERSEGVRGAIAKVMSAPDTTRT